MAKIQELSLFDVIGEKKNRYEFSFVTTFNAFLPFYEQIVLRRLIKAGCRVNTLLMDAGQFAASIKDAASRPAFAGRDYTIVPVDAGGGVFHPKILLLLGKEYSALCVGSHNLTLSGFGKNRELTTLFEISPESEDSDRRIFQDVWKALRTWTAAQPEELVDPFLFVEKEISWLNAPGKTEAEASALFFGAPADELSLWEQIKPILLEKVRRATLISPFFDEELKFLREIKDHLNPKEFIVGIEANTVQISPKAQIEFPDIKFVETGKLRQEQGYLHAKAIYIETESGEEILINGSANMSSPAWLKGSRHNCESVVVLRSKEAASAVKSIGLRDLAKSPAIDLNGWQLIERNKLKRTESFAEEDKRFLLTAIETETGFKIVLKKNKHEFNSAVELVNVHGETICAGEISHVSNEGLTISVEDSRIRFLTGTIKLGSVAGESFTAFVHHTSAIVAKFHKSQHREFFAALENFDIPVDNQFWRLFEKIVFAEGDQLPDYMEAQLSHRTEQQNLRARDNNAEGLQETFAVETADIGFTGRLNQNSLDSVSELLGFLNRRLYSPGEFIQNPVSPVVSVEEELIETEDYETDEIVDPKFEIEKIASLYYQRTRTMLRRMTKKLTLFGVTVKPPGQAAQFAVLRQLAVVLSVLHWVRQLKKTEKFTACQTDLVSIDDEWKLFVEAVSFLSSLEVEASTGGEASKPAFSDELSMVTGYLLWLGFDCEFDVVKLDDIRKQNYEDAERSDGWTEEEILDASACFVKLAVRLAGDDEARGVLVKALENDDSAEWLEQHTAWMNKISEASKDLGSGSVINRRARFGDLVYLTKIKQKEILVVSDDSSSIKVIMLNAENRFKKYSPETVAVIDFS